MLLRMTTPQPRKRGAESLSELNEPWRNSERGRAPDSKRQRTLSTNLTNGLESPTKKRGEHMTLTSRRSMPTLLSRMETVQPPGEPPNLQNRQSPVKGNLNEPSTRLRTSLISSQGENQMTRKEELGVSEGKSEKTRCPGITPQPVHLEEAVASKPAKSCRSSAKIYPGLNHSYESPITSPTESLHPNGTDFSEENLSTLTKSSHLCTLSSLMKRERGAWEQLRSCLQWQKPRDWSKPEQNSQLSCLQKDVKGNHLPLPPSKGRIA